MHSNVRFHILLIQVPEFYKSPVLYSTVCGIHSRMADLQDLAGRPQEQSFLFYVFDPVPELQITEPPYMDASDGHKDLFYPQSPPHGPDT